MRPKLRRESHKGKASRFHHKRGFGGLMQRFDLVKSEKNKAQVEVDNEQEKE